MADLQFSKLHDKLDSYDLFLFDLWGVVIEGTHFYYEAIKAINDIILRKKVIFLTNAPRPNFIVADNLTKWGFKNITNDMVVTSGDVAREVIQMHDKFDNGIKIYHLGDDRNRDILLNIDHKLVHDITEADILLLSLYRDDHEDIHEYNDLLAQAATQANLLTICCNPDTTIPLQGATRYCAGYFAAIIERHGGSVLYSGKPNLPIYDKVLEKKLDIPKNRILMIGDTFETDILGAKNAGIDSALVTTGNSLQIHGSYGSMDEKLTALYTHAKRIDMMPSFVTNICL